MINIDTTITYTGHIARFYIDKCHGFIETEDESSFFFYFDKREQKRFKKQGQLDKVHCSCPGDEVEFKLKASIKDADKYEAYDLKFIQNVKREMLVEEAREKRTLAGYLKKVDEGQFFVKHISTYVYIPVEISEWETDFSSIYTDRINTLVKFQLLQLEKLDVLKARLVDRKFSSEYKELIILFTTGSKTEALVTGVGKKGFFTKILGGKVEGFIHLPQRIVEELSIKKGETVLVKVKHLPNGKTVSLELAD
jgi:hypothetical protein